MTIINISRVTDNSGETPVFTYSNPVTTVIRTPSVPIFIPFEYDLSCCRRFCDCCCNCCDWCDC